jgi:hypothetical protein
VIQKTWLNLLMTTNRTVAITASDRTEIIRVVDSAQPELLTNSVYDRIERDSPLPEPTRRELLRHGASLRRPWEFRSTNDPQGEIAVGTTNLSKHRFSRYYYDLASFLNQETTIQLGRSIRDEYWAEYNPFNKAEAVKRFMLVVGYHDKLKPQAHVQFLSRRTNRFDSIIDELECTGRFRAPFRVFRGRPLARARGIVLAIHGRSSGPDLVMGLGVTDDYQRSFGAHWQNNGYLVYAPQVDWWGGIPLDRLGYTHQGGDLAKLLDLISFIKAEHPQSEPVIAAGVSYGSLLAECLGIISSDVHGVVSIGGNARGDYFVRLLKGDGEARFDVDPEKNYDFGYLPPDYHLYYDGIGLYKLIAPKPLVISIGSYDHDDHKFEHVWETLDYYKALGLETNVVLNVFRGEHESDPVGEIIALESIPSLRRSP